MVLSLQRDDRLQGKPYAGSDEPYAGGDDDFYRKHTYVAKFPQCKSFSPKCDCNLLILFCPYKEGIVWKRSTTLAATILLVATN